MLSSHSIYNSLCLTQKSRASALYITELDKRSLHPHLLFLFPLSHSRSLLTHPQWRQGLIKSQLPSPLLSVHGPTVHTHECPHQSDGMVLVFSLGTGEPGRVFSSLSHLRPAPHHTASLPMINRLSESLYTPTRPWHIVIFVPLFFFFCLLKQVVLELIFCIQKSQY